MLFRESERLDLRRWLVHLVRDREDTPSLAEAFFCVVLIFVIQFFTQLAISAQRAGRIRISASSRCCCSSARSCASRCRRC